MTTTIKQRVEERRCACDPFGGQCLLHWGQQKVVQPYRSRGDDYHDDDPRPVHVRRERTRRR